MVQVQPVLETVCFGLSKQTETVNLVHCVGAVSAVPELQIKPLGVSFTRPAGGTFMMTCEVTGEGVVDTADYQMQWLDKHGRPITDTTGRYVNRSTANATVA